MNANELKNILKLHKKWLNNEEGGLKANLRGAILYRADLRGAILYRVDLRGADLRGANLRGADLREANLRGAILYRADLREADLREADLSGADLSGANLYEANLRRANLYRADLCGAILCKADLREANLRGAILYRADFCGADLREATLHGADLRGANLREAKNIPFIPYTCPDTGSFIGYKKANGYIVVLEILSDARRCSATDRKCRCDKAKVLEIQNLDGSKANVNTVASGYDSSFIYTVGEIVEEPNFDEDRWNECSAGIHFFTNRQEAVVY